MCWESVRIRYVYIHIICVCARASELEGVRETVGGVNGRAVRFSKSGGPLVETLSESKSFLERQTLLIFLLFSIFFYIYIKSKAIEKWIIKKLEDLHLPKKEITKTTKKIKQMGLVIEVNIFVNVYG